MLHCKIGIRKVAAEVRDKLSRCWDCILVPMAPLSLLPAHIQQIPTIFKMCHTLDTGRSRDVRRAFLGRSFGMGERREMAFEHYSSQ
jgi:hypothetical protein